jgi:hypothetical protein
MMLWLGTAGPNILQQQQHKVQHLGSNPVTCLLLLLLLLPI